ncbi:DUF4145 domain-containing protein [Fundidesulfovibrio magnetotacticus]|uniref:DUF4145 domain-containing protein n=1 Tax=Fundidesulfovibrio magnetotacticus TaxID=2730080 RepID=UPI001564F501|nr:DUF4145 domain-containing protein [Fundidesulfovibrio magnetotacticus]
MHEEWFSEWQDSDPDDPPVTTKIYFPKIEKKKAGSLSFDIFVTDEYAVKSLHDEIYKAINNDMPQLAAAGIRTLIDRFAVSITGKNQNFEKNIGYLCDKGHISIDQLGMLTTILDVGHSVVHRSNVPRMEDVETCLRIIELLMVLVNDGPEVAARIKSRIPERTK